MNISIDLVESGDFVIDFEQSDVENMWNYLQNDRENFEYTILQYLNNNIEVFGDEWIYDEQVKALYDNLKKLFEEE